MMLLFLNDILYIHTCIMLWTAYYSTDVLYKNLYIPRSNLSSSILFGIIYIYICVCDVPQSVACWNFMYSYVLCQKWRINHLQSINQYTTYTVDFNKSLYLIQGAMHCRLFFFAKYYFSMLPDFIHYSYWNWNKVQLNTWLIRNWILDWFARSAMQPRF